MYHAMDAFREGGRSYQRALRKKGFSTVEQAKSFAEKRATGIPFVCQGQKIVWVG